MLFNDLLFVYDWQELFSACNIKRFFLINLIEIAKIWKSLLERPKFASDHMGIKKPSGGKVLWSQVVVVVVSCSAAVLLLVELMHYTKWKEKLRTSDFFSITSNNQPKQFKLGNNRLFKQDNDLKPTPKLVVGSVSGKNKLVERFCSTNSSKLPSSATSLLILMANKG